MSDLLSQIEKLALPGVRGLQAYQPGKPIDELERELGITDIIKLASNENPLGPGGAVLRAINAELSELSRYPDGNGFALKSTLAKRLAVDTSQITLGNGSNDILELVARAFVSPENEVIFSQHSFAVYPIVTQAVGAKAVVVPALNWGNDLPAMLAAITDNTRLVFIANPNNPTGTYNAAASIANFVRQVPEHVLVVIDEAYFEYAQYLCSDYATSLPLLSDYSNLLITRTFSKAYGLAGLRIGFSISSPAIANFLNRVRQPFNVNSLAMVAAQAALSDDDYLQQSLVLNDQGIKQYESAFAALGLKWIPTAGNFICVNLAGNGRDIFEALLREGVIVRPVDNYAMPEYLRITVGTEAENNRCIDALKKVLSQ